VKIKNVINVLKMNGYKVTEQRKAIAQSILDQESYLSAKEILNLVQRNYPGVSFDTIYRNLAILAELELVEETQIAGESRYKISCVQDHHHHLLCTSCGSSAILADCPIDLSADIAGKFRVTGHKFEIYGLCEKCQ